MLRGDPAVAAGWLERAARLLEGLEPGFEHAWLAGLRAHLELLLWHDLAAADVHAREAFEIARAVGAVDIEMLALAQQGLLLVSRGQVVEGMRRLDEATAAAVAGELSDPDAISTTCRYLIYACKRVRDWDRAAQWCARVQEISRRFSDRFTFAACRAHYADILIVRGSWAEADAELAANVRELGELNPSRVVDGAARLAELRRRQGRLDEAEALVREARAHPLALLVAASLALDRGDALAAAELAERFLRRIPPEERTERVAGLELAVRARAAAGDLARARDALAELEVIASTLAVPPLQAVAAHALGCVQLAAGEVEAARTALEDAVDLFEQSRRPFECAQARLALAEILRSAGREPSAGAEARTALDILTTLGAAREAERAAGLLSELGARPRARAADPAGLTAREREVLGLIARGRSNQEIAAELVLSVRTVERHISNIYDKIGAAGKVARATAAAYAHSHGLL